MKKHFLLLLSFIVLISSCRAKVEIVELSVNPKLESYTFPAEGESINISVITNQESWNVSSSNTSWCTVSKSGNTALITADKNTNEKKREDATVTFTAGQGEWAVSVTMIVNQDGAIYIPEYDDAEYDLSSDTKILSEETVSVISKYDSSTNTMTYPANYGADNLPKVGDKIVIPTVSDLFPNGFVGKVKSVNSGTSGTDVAFDKIPINEAFNSLKIDTTALDLGSHVKEIIGPNGEAVSFVKTKGVTQTSISFDMPSVTINTDENFSFTPKISVEIGMRFQLVVYEGEILSVNIIVDPETTLGVDFTAGIESELWKYESNPYTIICAGFPVGPVVVTPIIKISAVAGVTGKAHVTAGFSTKYKSSAGIRYLQGGWETLDRGSSVEQSEDDDPISLSGSLNLEGKVYGGAKFGAGVGIYGDVLSFDLAISPKIQATANINFDLNAFTASQSLYRTLNKSAIETALSASLDARVTAIKIPVEEFTLAEVALPLDKYYFVPHFSGNEVIAKSSDGSSFDVNVEIDNSLFMELPIGIKLYKSTTYGYFNRSDEYFISDFSLGKHSAVPEGEEESSYSVSLSNLTPGQLYYAVPYCELAGQQMCDEDAAIKIQGIPSDVADAYRNILMDIYNSLDGEKWTENENWGSDKPITKWHNVTIDNNLNMTCKLSSTHPSDYNGSLKVSNHTSKLENCGTWSITGFSSYINIKSVDIDDEYFSNITDKLPYITDYIIKSAIYVGKGTEEPYYWQRSFPTKSFPYLTNVEIGGNRTRPIRCNLAESSVKTIKIENLPNITSVEIYDDGDVSISIKETPSLSSIVLTGVNIDNFSLASSKLNSSLSIDFTADYKSTLSMTPLANLNTPISLSISGTFPSLEISNICLSSLNICMSYNTVDVESLSISECSSSSEDGFPLILSNTSFDSPKKINSTTITNCSCSKVSSDVITMPSVNISSCPILKSISVNYRKVSSFSISNLPGLIYLDCRNNNLKQEVPTIFDEIKARGGQLYYDIRYSYPGDGTYIDSGVGFWYPGEPGSGKHKR